MVNIITSIDERDEKYVNTWMKINENEWKRMNFKIWKLKQVLLNLCFSCIF